MSNPPVIIQTLRTGDMAALSDPRTDLRRAMIIAGLFFVLFLGWAAFFRLDAASYATGVLEVSGQRQAVQHREGGIVSRIAVQEGARVNKGDVLVELAGAEVLAQKNALQSQAILLLAQEARLKAEQRGSSVLDRPALFASLDPADQAEAAAALRQQQIELAGRRSVLAAQRGSLGERASQAGAQGIGFAEQSSATREQIRLVDQQITALKPLADKGFVSQTRLRQLEMQRADLMGQSGQYAANVSQARNAATENRIRMLEAERSFQERSATELREVTARLADVLPRLAAARDQLARTQVRAPVSGTVVGLTVFSQGGVIAPGQKILDIVPDRMPLVIQARFLPTDADDLNPGQLVMIKFPGLHDRSLPNFEGTLTRLSADGFTDEKTGQSYFTAEVRVPPSQVDQIKTVRGKDFTLRAGMPVEVLVPLRKRTALSYALEPLTGSFWRSLHEH